MKTKWLENGIPFSYKTLFTKRIFFGAGDFSVLEVRKIKKQLAEVLGLACGLQQPPHSETEEQARLAREEFKKACERVDALIKSIVIGLGGEKLLKSNKETDQQNYLKALEKASIRFEQTTTGNKTKVIIKPSNSVFGLIVIHSFDKDGNLTSVYHGYA